MIETNLAPSTIARLELELALPGVISEDRSPGPRTLAAVSGQRDMHGRFSTAAPLHELLDGVAEVARAVAGSDELTLALSKSAWNVARDRTGRTDLPSAEAIRQRIGLSWPLVLELALCPVEERGRFLGGRRRRPTIFSGEQELAIAGLRAVALRVSCSPSVLAYDSEVVKLELARERHKLHPLGLPHSQTIVRAFRSRAAALEAAGLEPLPMPEPPRRRAEPAAVILDRCIEQTGILPSRTWFEAWCRASDILLGRDSGEWERVVTDVRALRSARGVTTPSTPPVSRAGYPLLPEPPVVARRRIRKAHTRADAIASLRHYRDHHLGDGQRPRFKHYQTVATRDPQLVAATTLHRHGRVQELCPRPASDGCPCEVGGSAVDARARAAARPLLDPGAAAGCDCILG